MSHAVPIDTAPTGAATLRQPHALAGTPPTADHPHWTETLRDGTHVIIRPLHAEDVELERRFIERLSPESRRMRFLGQMSSPSAELLRQMTQIDYVHDMAFVALVHRDGEKREVGVSRYSVGADGAWCECAVSVDDEWHGLGLGTLLMRHLIETARARGIRSMISLDSADNWRMRELATHLGFVREQDPDDARQVIHRLTL